MSKNFLFHILQAICSNNKLLWFKIPFKCKNDQDKREEMISSPQKKPTSEGPFRLMPVELAKKILWNVWLNRLETESLILIIILPKNNNFCCFDTASFILHSFHISLIVLFMMNSLKIWFQHGYWRNLSLWIW